MTAVSGANLGLSQADNATVVLEERDQGYGVRVSDDGVGFASEELKPVPGHLGLTAMRELASWPAAGFRSIPLRARAQRPRIPGLAVPGCWSLCFAGRASSSQFRGSVSGRTSIRVLVAV